MWRRKKFILITIVATVVLLAGSIGGVAFAQTGSDNTTQSKTLLTRVAEILGVDQQKVEDAFTQARSEMQTEALDNYLNDLVAQGKMTQEQADQYKTWLQSRPNSDQYRQQLRDWQQTRPDVPQIGPFGGGGFRGGMMRGGGGGRFGCW